MIHQLVILQAQPSAIPSLVIFAGIIVFFFFFVMRPQMKKQKQEKNFQETLKTGKMVVTTCGIHGRISQIMDDSVVLETMAGKLKFEKTAISRDLTTARYPEHKETKEK